MSADPAAHSGTGPHADVSDLLLSSGFLAFSRHIGVLQAIDAAGCPIGAVTGTSSGALIGALWCAGWSGEELERRLGTFRPIELMRPHLRPWDGFCSLSALVAQLRAWLPARFEELSHPFAVGVVDVLSGHRLLQEGPLPEAVAASCAVPVIFAPIELQGRRYRDGGYQDRLGLSAHERWRGPGRRIVHLVDRSMGAAEAPLPEGSVLVRTPRSGASFLSLGPFSAQVEEARRLAEAALRTAALQNTPSS